MYKIHEIQYYIENQSSTSVKKLEKIKREVKTEKLRRHNKISLYALAGIEQ